MKHIERIRFIGELNRAEIGILEEKSEKIFFAAYDAGNLRNHCNYTMVDAGQYFLFV